MLIIETTLIGCYVHKINLDVKALLGKEGNLMLEELTIKCQADGIDWGKKTIFFC